ncbi:MULTISPECIES: bifunctional phosphopantothenoylcysteine decarboxylase/phosphopantothenate--cysteine ligase CoaBC [Bacillus]|uniref:bifunctional phosphopantothenoylcysteine decarboxylase/phosphopantothenate--cysteine ligase CoaBC n=1 Tax=Bacillus TaxID=1386 RepID=UPI000C76E1B7|nr:MULTISPECIES: bifunctional phosphopantothenoylcysteine decarboxylase/phosphopantothenate--cysteine ligase CoaBC [Bacillus]MCA1034634.1 bifunctional phosphopantothenoylcysteine decarboxylase/phosphopantothenate--cysteine ligase CoaBC [Bacillus infantis]MCK6203851.1 bifunctional phosphopantothenoylcysteine decarboxylase/phosphopantothenate--cysteine ligase CoaBC [Bacillus infantis]MCP1157995.1 bifunctional phosphopantothenoylcysteine decarboxylase/phosphopantothenate--cysteine ligase CoaBC [Bac
MLNGKRILLCVTGGIAVYKAAALTSKLTQAGAEVKVMMSESAVKFVAPLTFQALSRHDVYIDTFDEKDSRVIAHIDLADWADLILVAPATANVIGKLANGIADNMITTTLLAATAPVWIAPAMNVHMYDHPAVQKNIKLLYEYGCRFIEPGEGYLACGYVGKGRLEEPEMIVSNIEGFFRNSGSLAGKKVVVTAGPTREKIDPVRYITNHSSGKMGYAIAEEALKAGALVTLISGPSSLAKPAGAAVIDVESAEEMYQAVDGVFDGADIVIKTAAVSDYRPKVVHESKVKKQDGDQVLELERTKDILLDLGRRKKQQILIGFAAETDHVEEYARKKLAKKNADMIVANNVKSEGAGFGTDTNIITIYKRDGGAIALPLMSKHEAAARILQEASALLKDDNR